VASTSSRRTTGGRAVALPTAFPAAVSAALLTALLGGTTGGAALGSGPRSDNAPYPAGAARARAQATALVTLAGAHPVLAAGIRVRAYLPGIGVEVVSGDAAALARLRQDPGVAGLRADGPVRMAGDAMDSAADPATAFAWDGLGADAGRSDSGAGVTVAVVDTGISDTAVLDRASGRLVDGVDTSPLADGNDVRITGAFTDGFGHGTFLAGLLAGGPLPGGVRGLGVAPAARVVSVKVADDDGATSLSAVLAGLDWVATHRPIDVVSLALAADPPSEEYGADPLTAAVEHLRQAGLTVVVAAGNTAGRIGDPGFDPQALTVGAANTTGLRPSVAPFSGSGRVSGVQKPDLVAAGVHVLGIVPDGSTIARTYPDAQRADGLWSGSGTSEATAVAAGVAAIYLSAHPNASPLEVKSMLRGAARPMNGRRAGAGLLAIPTGNERPDPGEDGLDASAWGQNSWDVPGWAAALAASWGTDVYRATDWSADPWRGGAGNPSWSAEAWSAKSWSAKSWSAKSWSAKSWSAKSWSGSTFGAALPGGAAP